MNMKLINTSVFIFFLISFSKSFSQEKADTFNTALIIKMLPFQSIVGTVVYGRISVTNDSLFFKSTPCSERAKKMSPIFPCNSHLIKPVGVSFQEIKKMKRRAYFFLIPNRLFIQTKTNDTYLFITYKRRAIIRRYLTYLATLNEAKAESRVGKTH
jgi:hypothetical protein